MCAKCVPAMRNLLKFPDCTYRLIRIFSAVYVAWLGQYVVASAEWHEGQANWQGRLTQCIGAFMQRSSYVDKSMGAQHGSKDRDVWILSYVDKYI